MYEGTSVFENMSQCNLCFHMILLESHYSVKNVLWVMNEGYKFLRISVIRMYDLQDFFRITLFRKKRILNNVCRNISFWKYE